MLEHRKRLACTAAELLMDRKLLNWNLICGLVGCGGRLRRWLKGLRGARRS